MAAGPAPPPSPDAPAGIRPKTAGPARGFQQFTLQIRLFLVLLVLFLGVADVLNLQQMHLLKQLLQEEFVRKLHQRTELAVAIAGPSRLRAWLDQGARGDRVAEPIELRPQLRRLWVRSFELLDSRERSILYVELDPASGGEATFPELTADQRRILTRGEIVVAGDHTFGPPARASLETFQPLLDPSGELQGVMRLSHNVTELALVHRRTRHLIAFQVIGLFFILVLTLFFSQWLMTPFRLLHRALRGEVVDAPRDQTGFLVQSYEEIIKDLREKERLLTRLGRQEQVRADRLQRFSHNIVQSLLDGIVVVRRDGRIAEWNRAMEALMGRAADWALGELSGDVFSGVPALAEMFDACLKRQRRFRGEEVILQREDGTERILGVTISPLLDRDGEMEGALGLISDLTTVKQMQEQMQQQERLAGLGELSAGIAHEFRNSLAAVMGYARLIGKAGTPEMMQEYGSAIAAEARQSTTMVNDFMRFAEPTTLNLGPIALRTFLEEIVGDVAHRTPPGVRFRFQGEFPTISGDETLLRQAFSNLVRNALDAMAEADRTGTITLSGTATPDDRVIVEVADEGPGIPPDVLPKIFQPFVTTKSHGTGLGLSLTHKVVLLHGGRLRAANAGGGGAVFQVTLPREAVPMAGGWAAPETDSSVS